MMILGRLGAALAVVVSSVMLAAAESKVAAGLPAPDITVARWVKGTPVKSFESGKVYVVEFWATWCGPCKQSIPHLTELAKKYAGKATFTGVSVWEKNAPVGSYANYGDKVAAFVKDWGDKMNYNVAWDGDNAAMAKNWMDAAGQGGIPTAFIVDQSSKVVWIGHPMVGLDEALGQVIAGTFDVQAEAAKEEHARKVEEQQAAARDSYMKPLRAGDFKGGVAAIDKIIAAHPATEVAFAITRYVALSNYDAPAANEYARKLETSLYKGDSMSLNAVAWAMVGDNTKAKGVDTKLAIEIGEKCIAITQPGQTAELAENLDTLACCYFKDGQIDKAIETEKSALKSADAAKEFDASTRKELADRLEQFKQKKGSSR